MQIGVDLLSTALQSNPTQEATSIDARPMINILDELATSSLVCTDEVPSTSGVDALLGTHCSSF